MKKALCHIINNLISLIMWRLAEASNLKRITISRAWNKLKGIQTDREGRRREYKKDLFENS